MMKKYKKVGYLMFVLFFLFPSLVSAQLLNPEKVNSEVKIDKNGKVIVENAKIMQFTGNTVYARLFWDEAFIRITIKTNNKTVSTKKYGESTTVAEIKLDDRINVEGSLEPGTTELVMTADSMKNVSDERQQGNFSGTIIGNANAAGSFILKLNNGKSITIVLDGAEISKGTKIIGPLDVQVGNFVQNTEGVFNNANQTLSVRKMRIYLDMSIFAPRNFQGTLKSISGSSLPTTMTVNIEGKDYTVKVAADAWVWNVKRLPTQLSRFVVGDTVRMYGAIPEGDMPIINASIVRNINL